MTIQEKTRQVRTTSLGWMIQRIAGQLDRTMGQRLGELGLNLQQFAVLMTVLETDGLTQTEIGDRFGMPAYAISRAIDRLESLGYLARKPHPTSRRAVTINATEHGIALSERLYAIVRDVNAELTGPLTADERATFGALLKKLL